MSRSSKIPGSGANVSQNDGDCQVPGYYWLEKLYGRQSQSTNCNTTTTTPNLLLLTPLDTKLDETIVNKILHITHSQWLFCNFMLHDKALGYLSLHELTTAAIQIDALMQVRPSSLPAECQFLLDFDTDASHLQPGHPTILDIHDGSRYHCHHTNMQHFPMRN